MILSKTFEPFVKHSPISVMVRGTLENVFARESLDELFVETARRQREDELLFSSVVELLSLVVAGTRRSIHDAYQHARDEFEVSVKSIYNKLNRTEPDVSRELVRRPAGRLSQVIRGMKACMPAPLRGYRTKIIDGNHLAGTDHRIKELRTTRSGALPGQALVVLEPELMLATDVFPCEDGHAQERSLLPQVVPTAEPNDLWIADRNFCTTDFLFGLAARGASFVIRRHASTLSWECVAECRQAGRCETGIVNEDRLRLRHPDGETMVVRRVTLVLDKPTRKGDGQIEILTNIPARRASATKIAMLYRERWTVENMFQELSQSLHSEINTLGYPKAALLGLSVALLTYNAISTAKAALRAAHGEEAAPKKISGYYLAGEIGAAYHGMMIAIPPRAWTRQFADLTVARMASILKQLAEHVQLRQFRKHTTSPKKPPPKRSSGRKQKHVSTARLLAKRKTATAKK